ncbi:MAG TPA: T9SS type A sorting domain-containing protein, partial [Bacteroidia bacterium]|nr:T9SS type A sorting domain-containing protein [Bacteroidia bacterium]
KIVLSTGIISTVIGTGVGGFSGDSGLATAAEIHGPKCVALDDSGNMFVADWLNNRIRKVEASTGIITTIAGNGNPGFAGDGAAATAAALNSPYRVALDKAGNFYIADGSDNRVRWVNVKTGIINTLAGNGQAGFYGDGGPASMAELDYPPGLAFDHEGDLYIADIWNNRVREIEFTDSSIPTLSDEPNISVYPNPARTEATVYFSNSYSSCSIALYNIAGQIIWQTTKESYLSQINIPLNGLNSGIYMLEVQIENSAAIWRRLDVIR